MSGKVDPYTGLDEDTPAPPPSATPLGMPQYVQTVPGVQLPPVPIPEA